jgi:hypothetical protein
MSDEVTYMIHIKNLTDVSSFVESRVTTFKPQVCAFAAITCDLTLSHPNVR